MQSLKDALLRALDGAPADKNGLRRALVAAGFSGYCDTSSINSALYDLLKRGRVRRIDASPPIWAIERAPTPPPPPAAAPSNAASSARKSASMASTRSTKSPTGAATRKEDEEPPTTLNRWEQRAADAAVRILSDGEVRRLEALVREISDQTGVPAVVVRRRLLAGIEGLDINHLQACVRPSFWLAHAVAARLPDMLLTPAGNPRTGSVRIEALNQEAILTSRVEVVDAQGSEPPFWYFALVQEKDLWRRLGAGTIKCNAQALGPGWALPLRKPARSPALPEILVWRCSTPDEVLAAVQQLMDGIGNQALQVVTVETVVVAEPIPSNREDAEVSRLVRRRRSVGAGRRHAIQGSCDHCGQPLSDPYSLLVGIGPVCRGYYSPRVLARVAAAASAPSVGGGRGEATVKQAVANIVAAWR